MTFACIHRRITYSTSEHRKGHQVTCWWDVQRLSRPQLSFQVRSRGKVRGSWYRAHQVDLAAVGRDTAGKGIEAGKVW
jgi:hypothetical protein